MSCATPKPYSPGVHFREKDAHPHGVLGLSMGCGGFLEVFLTPPWGEVCGEVLLNATVKADFGVLRSGSQL